MSSTSRGAAGSPEPTPAPSKWTFTREEMRRTASQLEGMSREEEMSYRQMAAAFIQEMVDGLNIVKDQRHRIGHTGLCVAHTHMHRFYYVHSFKKFDYRDVGAACVFLAGKSQECPRKLSHVIDVWRDRRDRKPQLVTAAARTEAANMLVLLESMILQTIAFDLNVYLPHTKVLEIMSAVDKENKYKKMCNCAYYFASDVIAVTDWSLRYSAPAMAVAIIHLVAAYANVKIEQLFANFLFEPKENRKVPWWYKFDKTMTEEKLREMEIDFLSHYRANCKFHHAAKLNLVGNPASRSLQPLENPDVANRRVDRGRSNSPMVPNTHHQLPVDSNGRARGYVPKDELTVERLNKERVHEEERRKRDHDRMSGRIDNSTSSEKRARIDPLYSNFVSSTTPAPASNGPSTSSNGSRPNHQPTIPQASVPSNNTQITISTASSSSGSSRNAVNRRIDRNSNPSSSSSSPAFRASARAFDVAPMLTPPVAPKLTNGDHQQSDMDLEDGELE